MKLLASELRIFLVVPIVWVGALGAAAYIVKEREGPRPGPEIVERAQRGLDEAQANLAALSDRALLPPLDPTWTKVLFISKTCGLQMTPVSGSTGAAQTLYAGPTPAWHASITGPRLPVIGCAMEMTQNYPVILDTLSMNEANMTLTLSILGRKEDLKL